jgi:polynucleotide 5'-hydroxyl-kinase GRC3/NOL9
MVLAAVEIEDDRAFCGFVSEEQTPGSEMNSDGSKENRLDPASLVLRTPEGLPYIPNLNDIALDPRYTRCLGLVLVRGIDTSNQELQVITPIPIQEIEKVKQCGRAIILVHGKFDPPTWAYTEDLYERSDQETSFEKDVEVIDSDTSEDDSDAEPERVENARDVIETPWVEVLTGNEKRPVGSKVWRVRRDLGRNTGA